MTPDDTIPPDAATADTEPPPSPFDVVAWHAGNVGVGGATAKAAALLFPNDSAAWAIQYLRGWMKNGHLTRPSTCAIYGCSYLRARGVDHEMLEKQYALQIGMAPAIVETVARSLGAWIDASTPEPEVGPVLHEVPEAGDIVRIGGLGVGELHMLCVTGRDGPTGEILSVDGGQLPDSTFVQARRRIMVIWNRSPWLVKPEAPYLPDGSPNGRPVTGRVVGARLP